MHTIRPHSLDSHVIAFVFGLSISLVLTFCAGDEDSAGGQTPADLEARVTALEGKIPGIASSSGSASFSIDTTYQTVESVTLEAPNDGFALVIASCTF